MDHERARSSFTCYYDELLSEDERTELDGHLAECSECRAEWESYKKTVEKIAGLRAAAPSEEFAANVTSEIRRRRIRRFWTLQNLMVFKTAVLSFILIAFVILLYLVYLFMFSQPPQKADQPGATSKDHHGVRIIGPFKSDLSKPEEQKKSQEKKTDTGE